MTESSSILVEHIGAVGLIALNRPESLNAFNAQLRRALREALDEFAADSSVRALVLTGAGRAFSAGADLKDFAPTAAQTRAQLLDEYGPSLSQIAEMPKPVIAALDGPAIGIGLAFALVCDLLVMAEDAYLQAPFNAIGLIPDGGLSTLLPRALGYRHAFEFVVESQRLAASECVALGLANRVVAAGEARTEALAWAQTFALRPARAIAATKRALRAGLDSGFASAIEREADLQGPLTESADFREGVAAFIEKRPPHFNAR